MHLSSEPLDQRFRRKASFHARAAGVLLVPIVILQVFLAGYYMLHFAGRTESAVVTDKRTWITTDDDGNNTHHYQLRAQSPGPLVVSEVARHDYGATDLGDRVLVRVAGRTGQLGSDGSIHVGFAIIMMAGTVGVIALYYAAARAARPWYAPGKKVVDRGSDRLDARTGLSPGTRYEKRDG